MRLTINIEASSKAALIKELVDMFDIVSGELDSTVCKGCETRKDLNGGCQVSGGSSQPGLNSTWKLSQEHPKISGSKGKK